MPQHPSFLVDKAPLCPLPWGKKIHLDEIVESRDPVKTSTMDTPQDQICKIDTTKFGQISLFGGYLKDLVMYYHVSISIIQWRLTPGADPALVLVGPQPRLGF